MIILNVIQRQIDNTIESRGFFFVIESIQASHRRTLAVDITLSTSLMIKGLSMIDRTELRTLQYIIRFNRMDHRVMGIKWRGFVSADDKGKFDLSINLAGQRVLLYHQFLYNAYV